MNSKMPHKNILNADTDFYKTFVEEYPYPVLRLDLKGKIIYANPASLPILLEWNAEVNDTVSEPILKIVNQISSEKNIAQKLILQHGQTFIELTLSLGKQGQFINIVGQDITIQRLTQNELNTALIHAEAIRSSLESAEVIGNFGSWELYLKDHSFYCSKGLIRILEYSPNEIINYSTFLKILLPEDRKILEQAMEAAIHSKQIFSCNYRIKLKNDQIKWLRSEVHPNYDEQNRPIKFVGTVQDVTDKIRNELELTEATLRADKATRAKAEFLANMSHEIRTPMNGVIGMCNLLLTTVKEPTQQEQLKIIQSCGNSLLDIINDILDYSKLEAGKIELENEPFHIHHITKEIVQLMHARAAEKSLILTYTPDTSVPSWFLGDTTRFRQILTNLVSNAIKFTEKGSVTITSSAIKMKNGIFEIQFSVKDTGIGIPESAKGKLFESFSQSDVSTTRKFGGTGLGLAICKGLCEKMGGKVWVESEINKGSTFHFTVLLNETHSRDSLLDSSTITMDPQMGIHNPLHILVAEDNRINQLVAVGLLEKLGYQPDVAANGLEVLKNLERKFYDLIFMDFHMPEMDGIETTKKIYEKYSSDTRPIIIALTASAMKEDVDRCLAAGMKDFLSKPIQISEIIRIINSINSNRKNQLSTSTHTEQTKEGSIMTLPNVIFDKNALISNFENLEDVLIETIDSFSKLHPSLLEKIKQAIDNKDGKALELSAHTLKGVISNFFAVTSKMLAMELEKCGFESNFNNAEKIFNNLLPEIKLLIEALNDLKLNHLRKAA